MGTFLYYLLWPLVWFYAPLKVRVRVALVCKGRILVVKNWFGPNNWQLPGGGRKFGESIQRTAYREILEELSITLDENKMKILVSKPVLFWSKGLLYRYQYVFVEITEKPDIKTSHEITDTAWKELHEISLPNLIRQELTSR